MIHRIEIAKSVLFDAVRDETAQHFRAMRVRTEGADSAYEDMVVTEVDYPALSARLDALVSSIYADIRGYTPEYMLTEDMVGFAVDMRDCNGGARVAPLLQQVMEQQLLAWWYNVRMPDLAAQYVQGAESTMSAIRSAVIPVFGNRKLRMF